MRRIRVLHIADTADRGGGETYLFLLAARLPSDRYAFSVLCPSEGLLPQRLRKIGIPVVPFAIPRLLSPAALVRLLRLLQQHKPDIIQSHGARPNFYAALAGRWAGVPVIVSTIHNSLYDYPISSMRRSLYLLGERLTFALSDQILCVANALAQDLIGRSGRDPAKIQVIRNGVDLEAFDPKTIDGSTVRREFGLEKDSPLIGIVGRMTPQKGYHDLLTALVHIRAAVPTVKALIVGDGPLRAELMQYAKAQHLEECCIFAGMREDIPVLIAALNVVALPSLSEGLPFVLLEAMAMGKPVVATRVNGVSEVVEDGVTALLVPPQAPQMLARAVIALLVNKELGNRLGEVARQHVERHFSLALMIQRVERLYEKLLVQRVSHKDS
ncbi:glycosyltransferase [Candidatus Methylomirabilis sp.]|uniref:glycosyltransferase n=1 Tax=Candidatus Methylomirabilis sp. TaxID=2032687 RepID=UPI0030760028